MVETKWIQKYIGNVENVFFGHKNKVQVANYVTWKNDHTWKVNSFQAMLSENKCKSRASL